MSYEALRATNDAAFAVAIYPGAASPDELARLAARLQVLLPAHESQADFVARTARERTEQEAATLVATTMSKLKAGPGTMPAVAAAYRRPGANPRPRR